MDRIAEIRERLEKATPGAWRTVEKGNSIPSIAIETLAYVGEPSIKICSGISLKTKNAEFIAHAHEDIPYLLGVIEQQQAEIERLKPLAELGELAVEAMKSDSSNFRCNGLVGIEDNYDGIEVCSMGDYEEGCPWQYFCAKRAELRGAE